MTYESLYCKRLLQLCAMPFLITGRTPGKSLEQRLSALQSFLVKAALLNLVVVALVGLWMRGVSFLPALPLQYKHILHGHSHFAFGGWVMPALVALLLKEFRPLAKKIRWVHWHNITVLMLGSAYGMLVSFPLQGYKAVSISFSTLSIAALVYLALVIWKALKCEERSAPYRFLRWGLLYGTLSALGALATGPLMAMGGTGSVLYYDAIYFYLHLQYNGLFTFLVMASLLKRMEGSIPVTRSQAIFGLLNAAVLPTYFLSVLWSGPASVFYIIGGIGALLQLAALLLLCKEFWPRRKRLHGLIQVSLLAFASKIILQGLSALPLVAQMAYEHRNLVIAYLHLVLLGFVSLYFIAILLEKLRTQTTFRLGISLFLFSFITTETLLVFNGLQLAIPYYTSLLFFCSTTFPLGAALLYISSLHSQKKMQVSLTKNKNGSAIPLAPIHINITNNLIP